MNTIEHTNAILDDLKQQLRVRPDVLAVIAFGSAVNGEAWHRSDVDVFVVVEGEEEDVQEAAILLVRSTPVHLQWMTRTSFLKKAGGLIGRPFHTALASSRILLCKDETVENAIRAAKQLPLHDRRVRVLAETGMTLSYLYYAGKFLWLNREDDARLNLNQAAHHWMRAHVFHAGRLPTRTVLHQATEIGIEGVPSFSPTADPVHQIEALREEVDGLLVEYCAELLDCLRNADGPLTSVELEERYSEVETDFARLLEALEEKGWVARVGRPFELNGVSLFEEVAFRPARR